MASELKHKRGDRVRLVDQGRTDRGSITKHVAVGATGTVAVDHVDNRECVEVKWDGTSHGPLLCDASCLEEEFPFVPNFQSREEIESWLSS